MISVAEARRIIKSFIPQKEIIQVPFEHSVGMTLASDLIAKFAQPRFDNSAMDGFALRAADTIQVSSTQPVKLKCVGTIAAGSPYPHKIRPGECIRIMTGGKLPEGTDAVIIVEKTSGFESDTINIYRSVSPGENIRFKGSELQKGKLLITAGTVITPAEIGIFATFGAHEVDVFRPPRFAVFGLGDELTEPGQILEEGKIYNSNLYILNALLKQSGSQITSSSLLKDDPEEIENFLRQALDKADIILSSGGISMGKFDYTKSVFEKLGIQEQFWKIAQKPGKPMFFGTMDEKMIFGLPGNPVSTIIGFFEYVRPVIMEFMGQSQEQLIQVPLKGKYPVETNKYRFLLGNCFLSNGKLVCQPTEQTGSHMLTSFLNSNCIIESPPSDSEIPEGEKVSVLRLPNFLLKIPDYE